jgi:hypothetical protein
MKEDSIKTGEEIRREITDTLLFITERNIDKDMTGAKVPSQKDDAAELEKLKAKQWADLEELQEKVRAFKRYRHCPSDFVSDNVTMVHCAPSNTSSFHDWLFNHYFDKYLEVKK